MLNLTDNRWFTKAPDIRDITVGEKRVDIFAAERTHQRLTGALMVVVTTVVALASPISSLPAGECPCYPSGPKWKDATCEDVHLGYVPDCVPGTITTLNIRTPSIPLVPNTVRRFNNLQKLVVENFEGPLNVHPEFLRGRHKIRYLEISGTSLDQVRREWFRHTPKITTLDLSHNRIAVLHPDVFSHLKALETVVLDHNRLTSLPPTLFEGTALKKLHIVGNPFRCDCELPTFMLWVKSNGVKIMEPTFCVVPTKKQRVNLEVLTHAVNCLS